MNRSPKPGYVLVFLFFLLLFLFCPLASAQNATYSTLDQLGAQDILIYTFDGNVTPVLYGQWNTTSVDIPLPATDFLIIMRPSADMRFMDPGLLLDDFIAFCVSNAVPLVLIIFFIGLLWKGR